MFENIAIHYLRTHAMALPDVATVPVRYYRDDTGLEASVIIELADGRWSTLEIKLPDDEVDKELCDLRRLKRKLTTRPSSATRLQEFVAVIVGISEFTREVVVREYVLSLRSLGA